MRIQVLPLPSTVVGEVVEEPFALIIDQWSEGVSADYDDQWKGFAADCGARAVLATPQTVEVVDRYAGPAAVEEIDRLAGFLLEHFPHEPGRGNERHGESAVDVAIRLLTDLSVVQGARKPLSPTPVEG